MTNKTQTIEDQQVMKTINDLFFLIGNAVEDNGAKRKTWFFDYHGHVNKLDIRFYLTGWENDAEPVHYQDLTFLMDEDGIQAAYWFIKTKLR